MINSGISVFPRTSEHKMIGRVISQWISEFFTNLDWVITQMDMTQWGIVSVIFVVIGFLALRTKL